MSTTTTTTTRSRTTALSAFGGSIIISLPFLGELYSRAGPGFLTPERPLGNRTSLIIHRDDEAEDHFVKEKERKWDQIEEVALVFHGAGGPDAYTDELMNALRSKRRKQRKQFFASMVDWSSISSNILQASFCAERVGRASAKELLQKFKNVKTVHLIGISVGAFAGEAAVQEIKKKSPNTFVQLTLLDPFLLRGVLRPGYGVKEFGKHADYAQQYLNTDDPVPSTNEAISNCACYDVTKVRPKEIFGHDWPLVYYARSKQVGVVHTRNRLEAGRVLTVER